LIYEYPLGGKPPMMTHIFENLEGKKIIATKGAPEAVIEVCTLSESQKENILKAMQKMAAKGYRVLGVGVADFSGTIFPKNQQDFQFIFKGLIAFYDPPKANIQAVFETFYKAGIQVKIITGDNAATTTNIAKQIGFKNSEKVIIKHS
jgi:Ca2+-transporting ATPase